MKSPRVAIVHDWLVTYAGAERCLELMLECFPEADLFSVVDFLKPEQRFFIKNKPVTTTYIQKMPLARKKYRSYLPLMPLAVEQLDVTGYDIVISSSHAVAKGVITGPDQLHICYIYSPMRYAWDLQFQYLKESKLTSGFKAFLAKRLLHKMRIWDLRTVPSVDHFVAISQFIARRVHKLYRREAKVIYPPVDVDGFELKSDKQDFYLTASRMVPYKKMDLIVEAFKAMPEKKLVVIGDGPDFNKIQAKAEGASNIQLLGYQPFAVLKDHMQRAKAFVFAAEEDFGIAPLEAQACGTPVIAYGKGGALETIVGEGDKPTGIFFYEQSVSSICQAVTQFEQSQFAAEYCRVNACRFSKQAFIEQFTAMVSAQWQAFLRR
jgi:glycosyltransferase involved in cell wall biosynthesis